MKNHSVKSKQNGAALLVALSFLVVITLISLTAMRSTTTELRLASNNEERVAAEQLAQSAVDAVMSNPDNFIVTGVEGTEDTSIALNSNQVSEFANASITVTEGTTANPPRGLGVSADKFQGTMFHIDGEYNNLDGGRGQAFIGQGIVLLVPKT
jgi:type IV pilus assembly protein PilX